MMQFGCKNDDILMQLLCNLIKRKEKDKKRIKTVKKDRKRADNVCQADTPWSVWNILSAGIWFCGGSLVLDLGGI